MSCCGAQCCPGTLSKTDVLECEIKYPAWGAVDGAKVTLTWNDGPFEEADNQGGWFGTKAVGEGSITIIVYCTDDQHFDQGRIKFYASFVPQLEPEFLSCCPFLLLTDYNFMTIVEFTVTMKG